MASSAITLSVVATPETSLVAAPADISAHWEVELRTPFEALATLRNLVLRSGPYVIRQADATVESVQWEHELLSFLSAEIPEVQAPLRARDGSTFLAADGRVLWLLPYVDAPTARRHDTRVRDQVPRLLARLHRVARAWPETRPRPGRPSWRDVDWVANTNEGWDWSVVERTPLIDRAYAADREWVASAPPLEECAVHGDFHPENLLASERGVEAVIDWEFARLDWAATDLAAAVTVLALQRDGTIDRAVVEETVGAYVEAGGRDESDALQPLMRQFLLSVALHVRTRKAIGASWSPEFQLMIETALASLV